MDPMGIVVLRKKKQKTPPAVAGHIATGHQDARCGRLLLCPLRRILRQVGFLRDTLRTAGWFPQKRDTPMAGDIFP